MNIDQADVAFATFNATDVRPIEIAGEGEGFLGYALLKPYTTHSRAELLKDSFFAPVIHWGNGNTDDDVESTDFTYREPE